MEQWNNVELTNLSKKSYTLNHAYDDIKAKQQNNNNNSANNNTNEDKPNERENGIKDNAVLLQPGSNIKPQINLEDVEALVRRLYGITTSEIKELISYDDRNYLIKEDLNIKNPLIVSHWPHGYVLKIINTLDSKKTDFVEGQNELLQYLSKQNVQCPRPIANASGKYYSVEHINGNDHVVRLLEFIPGEMFHRVEKTNYILYQAGEYLAKIDRALKNFSHHAYDSHKTVWMLQSIPQLREFLYVLKDHARKDLIEDIIEAFETNVLSHISELDHQIIHGDFNEQNIVVGKSTTRPNLYKVTGVIDFGDTNKSPIIFEISIAMAYMMLEAKSIESAGIFLSGYTAVQPITAKEKSYLKYCVAARLAQSLVMGAYTYSLDSSNDYVLVTQEQGWRIIEQLWRECFETVDELWETAGTKYLTQSDK